MCNHITLAQNHAFSKLKNTRALEFGDFFVAVGIFVCLLGFCLFNLQIDKHLSRTIQSLADVFWMFVSNGIIWYLGKTI